MLRSVIIFSLLLFPFFTLSQSYESSVPLDGIPFEGVYSKKIASEKMRYTNNGTYPFHVLGQNENLPIDMVYSLFQDSKGNVWIGGGGGGLVSFDGIYFYDYSHLPPFKDKNIMDIMEDRKGNLWFATLGHGMVQYDGKTFYEYSDRTGLPGERLKIIDLFEDASGRIWAATQKQGVLVVEDQQIHQIWDGIYGDTFGTIGQSPNGAMWFGSWTGNISILENGIWNCLTSADGLTTEPIKAIFPFQGKMWIGTMEGMFLSDGATIEPFQTECAEGIFKATQTTNGDLWVSARNQRVIHISEQETECFGIENGLPEGPPAGIMCDDQGSIWLGSVGNGIAKLESADFQHFTYEVDDIPQDVKCISSGSSDRIAVGYLNKEIHLYSPAFDSFEYLLELPYELHCLEWKENRLLIGTDHGAFVWEEGNLSALLPPKRFVQIVYDFGVIPSHPEHLAIGTSQGMYLIHDQDTVIWNKAHGLRSNQINQFEIDQDGWLWCATNDGLAIMPPDTAHFYVIGSERLTRGSVLSDLHLNDEDVWITNYGSGIYKAKKKALKEWVSQQDSIPAFQYFGNASGLPDQNALCMLEINPTTALVQTRRGIAEFNLENGKVTQWFSAKDGIKPKNLRTGGVLQGDSIAWWIGEHFVIRHSLESTPIRQSPPKIELASIDVFFKPLAADSLLEYQGEFSYFDAIGQDYRFVSGLRTSDQMPERLILSSDQNHLTFHFEGNDWLDPRTIAFQYFLEGEDEDWLPADAARKATYQNLSPGNYLLNYRAVGSDGVHGKTSRFPFSIHIPVWQTSWFIALSVIMIVLSIYLLFRWRMYRLRKENQALDAKVKERTKEVEEEKEKSDQLLLNILPKETADELKEKGNARTQQYEECSVIFSDFSGFTQLTETMDSAKLVEILDGYFQAWDNELARFRIEKIKTIGDAYMCASGLPIRDKHHALLAVCFALQMRKKAAEINKERTSRGEAPWNLRIGIHSGPVIAGVVGKKKFAYDIWGDTVNTAARMESSGIPEEINISAATYNLVKAYVDCTYRGKVDAKHKGQLDMYLVKGLKDEIEKSDAMQLQRDEVEIFTRP